MPQCRVMKSSATDKSFDGNREESVLAFLKKVTSCFHKENKDDKKHTDKEVESKLEKASLEQEKI